MAQPLKLPLKYGLCYPYIFGHDPILGESFYDMGLDFGVGLEHHTFDLNYEAK